MAENCFHSREKEVQSYEVSLLLLYDVQEVRVGRSRKMVADKVRFRRWMRTSGGYFEFREEVED